MAEYTYPNGGCACSRKSCKGCGCTVAEFGREYAKIRKLMTNADRIRAMSDEELAVYLFRKVQDIFDHRFFTCSDMLDWLKQEVDEC